MAPKLALAAALLQRAVQIQNGLSKERKARCALARAGVGVQSELMRWLAGKKIRAVRKIHEKQMGSYRTATLHPPVLFARTVLDRYNRQHAVRKADLAITISPGRTLRRNQKTMVKGKGG